MRGIVAGTAMLLVLAASPPGRADAGDPFARMLDRPAATKTVKPRSPDDPQGQITCTYYADLMVRETGTDSPDPNDAGLVVLAQGAARPACDSRPLARMVGLKTEGYSLVGRKGGYLIWDATDPNGAEPFKVMDAKSGRVLFEDGVAPTLGLPRTAGLDHGRLRLAYRRAVNLSCSLAQDTSACWDKAVAAGLAPSGLPRLTKPPKRCWASYMHTAKDDPSILEYQLELTIDPAGRSKVISQGPVICEPQP